MARKTSRANKPRRTEGYSIIYVIKSELLDAHKIGITNDWSRRKRELKVGISTTAVHVARINNAESLETYLHGKFQNSRLPQSEWFRLDENGLTFVRSAIRKAKDDYEHSQKARSIRSSNLNQGRSPSEYSYRATTKQDLREVSISENRKKPAINSSPWLSTFACVTAPLWLPLLFFLLLHPFAEKNPDPKQRQPSVHQDQSTRP